MSSEVRKQFVVLLQGDSLGHENKFVKFLEEKGIIAKSVSTLSFNFINQDRLHNCLFNADSYNGIIFTSTRAVNAVSSVLNSSSDLCVDDWKKKLNFSVGKATADLAMSTLNLNTAGSDSGNSENLCQIIIDMCRQLKKPLIFPCSNIRKDTIPVILSQNGIPFEEIICYETVPSTEFKNLWQNLISKEGLPEILIFFSPSGVHSAIETIKNSYSKLPKCIAIGPSTGKALSELGISCKVAEKPTPETITNIVINELDI